MSISNNDKELAFTPAYELIRMMKSKKISPLELMEAILRRIEELNPKLGAYLTVVGEQAISGAAEAEQAIMKGKDLGLLHGLPISIKDLYNTKGIRTTNGSLVFKDFVPDSDGPVVDLLKKAGAIIIGKTQAPEFGFCVASENKVGPPSRNPWDLNKSSGGSSGGAAAAVAAGISPIAQGSDGGGSVRIPASLCGVYGLKPSTIINRVPYDPYVGTVNDPETAIIGETATHGPITRNVRDAALMMNVISGPYPGVYNCIQTAPPDFIKMLDTDLGKLKIAWSRDLGYAKIDPEYTAIAEKSAKAFEELGCIVEEATPLIGPPYNVYEAVDSPLLVMMIGSIYDKYIENWMPYTKRAMEGARKLTAVDVSEGWIKVGKMRGIMRKFFNEYDLLITPSCVPAWPVGEILKSKKPEDHSYADWEYIPFTAQFNLTGNPAATCPCGFTSDGLPVGLQIVGKPEDEVTVLKASFAFEKIKPWSDKKPPIS